jgi:hypothetical protein
MDRMKAAKEFGRRETPAQQFEMVPPQPVACEPKRGFWYPKQLNEMGNDEILAKVMRLDRADGIVSRSAFWVTVTEMSVFIGCIAHKLAENGVGKVKLDGIYLGIGIAFVTTLLVTAVSRLCIVQDMNSCHLELLKRAEKELAK